MPRRTCTIAFIAALGAFPSGAQTISVEDLKAQIDEKLSAGGEYRALLADSDADRAMTAMQLMMASGDPELERMAREFGLYSSDPVVRRMAVEAWLKSQPTVSLTLDGNVTESGNFTNRINHNSGSVDSEGKAFVSMKLGDFGPDQDCYLYDDEKTCAFRIDDAGVSFFFEGTWSRLQLNEEGDLVGDVKVYAVNEPIPARIPVTD